MQPQFELSPEPLLKSGPEHLARYGTHQKTIIGFLNRSIFHLTHDWNGLQRGHYSSLHDFISFKLPILRKKDYHENPKRGLKGKQIKRTLKVGIKFKYQTIFLDL